MAQSTTPRAKVAPKASADDAISAPILDRLESLATEHDALVKLSAPVSAFTSKVDALVKAAKDQSAHDALVLSGALDGHLRGTIDALRNLDALSEILRPASSPDRAEGDALVAAFANLKAANNPTNPMLSPDAIKRGDALVTRWAASAPKRAGGTGQRGSGPGKPSLPGQRVVYKCKTCGREMSTGKDYLNSARDACVTHAKDQHGALIGRGTSDHDALTRALMRVGKFTPDGPVARSVPESERGAFESAEGGGFTITRKSA